MLREDALCSALFIEIFGDEDLNVLKFEPLPLLLVLDFELFSILKRVMNWKEASTLIWLTMLWDSDQMSFSPWKILIMSS